uniref:inorganic diphosphatase n=1 Tax=Ditylenchus dipsaci TaxID=166011 RepID=A0A915ELI1_9BILA
MLRWRWRPLSSHADKARCQEWFAKICAQYLSSSRVYLELWSVASDLGRPVAQRPHTGINGDNDPIDVVEIGTKIHKRGSIVQVKVLGILGLLDDGETDWKLVAIDVEDPIASQVNTVADVEAFSCGQFKDCEFAHKVIEETHILWKDLIQEKSPKLNTETFCTGAAYSASSEKWENTVASQPAVGNPHECPKKLTSGTSFTLILRTSKLFGVSISKQNTGHYSSDMHIKALFIKLLIFYLDE